MEMMFVICTVAHKLPQSRLMSAMSGLCLDRVACTKNITQGPAIASARQSCDTKGAFETSAALRRCNPNLVDTKE